MRVVRFRPIDQHDSEASFVSHHASVSFGGLCQRNGFDHRTDLLQGQESACLRRERRGRDRQVSSASIEEPVIVPASERIPNRSRTGATLIGSSPPAPATISWLRKLSGLAARRKSAPEKNSAPGARFSDSL